jgi:phytoene dehydrogenase-like protein
MDSVTIIGAGVTGLVAAIEAADRGWSVTLHEAGRAPGGRAATLAGPYRANLGPHGLYTDGSLWSWLERHALTPAVAKPPRGLDRRAATLVLTAGRLGYFPAALDAAIAALPEEAPVDDSFRSWLVGRIGRTYAEAIIGLLFVVTYAPDPGILSAAFMHERLRRSRSDVVRYVSGGFGTLVERLAERAARMGVELRTGAAVHEVGDGPTVVATSLPVARRITGDPGLEWPSGAAALLDLGLEAEADVDWLRIFDLDGRCYVARFSEVDQTLAPPGHDLVQAAAPCGPGQDAAGALRRVEEVLDTAWPGWRQRVRWQRRSVMRGLTGALDPPGTTWRDRPAIHRGGDLYVATDQSAAPGVLAEVGAAAAVEAVAALGLRSRRPPA